MINILLSVRRPFSQKILSGEKTWELRKTKPRLKRGGPVKIWLYESGKDGERAIIGWCRLEYLIIVPRRLPPWLPKRACVTEDYIRDYMRGYRPCYGWGVKDPVRLPDAVPLSDIGLTRPPQSWQYLTPEQADILERRGNESRA